MKLKLHRLPFNVLFCLMFFFFFLISLLFNPPVKIYISLPTCVFDVSLNVLVSLKPHFTHLSLYFLFMRGDWGEGDSE